jgi:23S rRNA-/tRNA-specific pseudouridylate synthase
VTLDGERCHDPATWFGGRRRRTGAPKLRSGPLAGSAIVYCDCDLVVVDKLAGMFSVDSKLGVVHRLDSTRAD